MTDQEMMELAALAAGLELLRDEDGSIVYGKLMGVLPIGDENIDTEWWNPKDDDGDALRLAVKLQMFMQPCKTMGGKLVEVSAYPSGRGDCLASVPIGSDPYAATRLAVLRAAAEMGKRMKDQSKITPCQN